MTEQTAQLARHIEALNAAGLRTNRFYELAYASLCRTREESIQKRRALAQAYILDNAPLEVHPWELIAGSMTGLCPCTAELGAAEAEEQARAVLDRFLETREKQQTDRQRNKIRTFEEEFQTKKSRWSLMSRVYHDGSVTFDRLQELIAVMTDVYAGRGIEKYEIGRELERGLKLRFGDGVRQEIDALPWFAANHLSLNYGRIAHTGIGTLQKAAAEALQKTSLTDSQREYYECAQITAAAMERFIMRYASAIEEAQAAAEGERAAQLAEMAAVCRRISRAPAAGFREALQLVWLCHIMASFLGSSALSFGRFDQYMRRFYEKDRREGKLQREEALELIECFWLKINEPKLRTVQSLTLGGVDAEGNDASSELTALCLTAAAELRLPYPNVGLRIHADTPEEIYELAVQAVEAGSGQPMLLNDRVWIPNLMRLGYSAEQARDYYNMGCVEIMIPNQQPNWGVTDPVAFPMLFEEVFSRVRQNPSAYPDYAQFYGAYLDVLKKAVEADRLEAESKTAQIPGRCYDPFASLLIDGCLEKGADMFQGGSLLGTHWSIYAYGLGTACDALGAVKKHVYEDKRYTITEMADALEKNFADAEPMRQALLRGTPHYGNDTEEADTLAADVLRHYTDMVMAMNSREKKEKYVTTLFGYFFHVYHGEITGATADGRLRGEPLSDSMGPAQGRDVSGPTALLNSALRIGSDNVTGGYALNLKVNPEICRTPVGKNALKWLFRAYMEDGGPQLQAYLVRTEDLKDAKIHPERHRNLIVRVGGYCEYFVNLDAALQEEIITRTEYGYGT